MAQEIERKFILDSLPGNLKCRKKEFIRQGYLTASGDKEIRIRQKGRRYYQTIKKGSGILRKEIEIRLNRKQFESLWPIAIEDSLEKTRFTYDWNGYFLEVDQYCGALDGLYTAEIEFPTLEESFNVVMPAFLQEEITFDPRFKNKELVRLSSDKAGYLQPLKHSGKIIGTIPFIIEDDEVKVILVTNRKKSQWIFPKGQDELHLEPGETALLEADEEAGIKGNLYASPIRVPYIKGDDAYNMLAFPIEVEKLKERWREDKVRDRKVLPLKDAYELSDQKAVHCSLEYLETLLV